MELKKMIADWVKAARTEADMSGAALGAKLALELGTERGHSKANISHWETQKHSPNLQQLLAIAKVTGKSLPPQIVLAMHGSGETSSPSETIPGALRVAVEADESEHFVQVRKVKLRLSAGITGFQTEPDNTDGQTISLPAQWVEKKGLSPSRLVAIRVKGESMEPALHEDDVVIVNTADIRPIDGDVYAVNYEGEAVVKRLVRDAGDWWLASDNSDQRKYHRKVCRGADCIIVGKVIRKESERI
jgi:phage repressor protein C with HTH and peptisase S24 domain